MKRVLLFLCMILLISGCGKYGEEDVIEDFSNNIEKSDHYRIKGTLEIYRNEELYTYNVDSAYQSKDKYRVSLINQTNNHEQIILKNNDGVFVLTPILNKSFKFQSEWPYNNSQIYLLQPLVRDINKDKDRTFEKIDGGYILTVKVTYDNDSSLKKQKIYLDKNLNLTKVEVLNNEDVAKMIFTVTDYNLEASFNDDFFEVDDKYFNNKENEKSINDKKNEQDNNNSDTTAKIDDVVYPMYVPVNTYLSNQDNVPTDNGERVILTFSGESPFLLVQETANNGQNTDFVYGDPYLVSDTLGAVTDYSVSWISNGVEYSVVSDNLNIEELIMVAESISTISVGK